jgi:hypothetical protein
MLRPTALHASCTKPLGLIKTMKRKELKRKVDGCILEIPLCSGYGYAYAKYIDGTKHPELGRLVDLIKVFDYKSDKPLEDLEVLTLKTYLYDNLLVAGLPPTITQGYWKVVGKFPIEAKDLVAPHYKQYYKLGNYWTVLIDGKKEERRESEEIKHLEPYSGFGSGSIEVRLSMAFMKKNGDNPEELLDMKDESINYAYSTFLKNN